MAAWSTSRGLAAAAASGATSGVGPERGPGVAPSGAATPSLALAGPGLFGAAAATASRPYAPQRPVRSTWYTL